MSIQIVSISPKIESLFLRGSLFVSLIKLSRAEKISPSIARMISLFEASTGRKPEIIGKPYATMVKMAAELLKIPVQDLMIVGDRIYTDMQMGFDAGCQTTLVLSGESTIATFEKAPRKPDLVFDNVECLLRHIKES